jgi:hypothetical protein
MFLSKLQNLPLKSRKIIFWSILIILTILLFSWWLKSTFERIKSFQKEEFLEKLGVPKIKEEIRKKIPKAQIKEKFNEIEKIIEEKP